MKLIVQRVSHASVIVKNKVVGEIEAGLLVLLGIHKDDDGSEITWLAKKLVGLRIFEDNAGKMNLSVEDIGGEILLISQFTLYGDCSKGRRPGFSNAASASKAELYYTRFAEELKHLGITPKQGIFGAFMNVSLENNGPVTMIIEK